MYRVCIARRAIRDIERIDPRYTRLVSRRINALSENPRPRGAIPLRGRTGYRLRVGVYRILYNIDDAVRSIEVRRVKHRREAYR